MIVQFFDYGSGLSKGPLDYLLGKNRDREHAKIISGDEKEIAELIDSSPFAKKYTSGCLSFYESDLSEEAKKQIMANFEKCLFPGMDQNQYRVLWIEHKDKINEETGRQRLELNFLIPNVEIESGQRLQPYYHEADMPRVDLFKKITNFEYQLHDPNDPSFRQATTTKKNLPKTVNEIKSVIDIEAQKAVEAGLITDRATMEKWLVDLGLQIERTDLKTAISIKNPHNETGRNIRLTGTIYEQDFRITAESAELTREASERYRQEAKQRNAGDIQRYRAHIERKSAELNDKYRHNTNDHTSKTERVYSADHAANRTAHEENFSNTDQAAGAVHSRSTSEISAVKQLEYRDSESLEDPRYSFEIKYSPDFNSLYSSYFQHCNERNQLREIHANSGQKSSNSSHRQIYSIENAGVGRFIHSDLQHQQEAQIEQKDGYASTVINDYRAATAAAQRATEAARASITAHSNAEQNDKRTRELLQQIDNSLQHADRERKRDEKSYQTATESEAIRDFITKLGEQLKTAITEPFRAISDWVKSKERDQRTIANDDLYRNREADSTIDRRASKETRLGEQLSRKISGFSTDPIFKALDEIDRRRDLQRVQERKNDRGYDSPSPF